MPAENRFPVMDSMLSQEQRDRRAVARDALRSLLHDLFDPEKGNSDPLNFRAWLSRGGLTSDQDTVIERIWHDYSTALDCTTYGTDLPWGDEAEAEADYPQRSRGGYYLRRTSTSGNTERQRADIEDWFLRGGLTATENWEDIALPGEGEGYRRMIEAVKARSVDWVVVQGADCLFRDVAHRVEVIDLFHHNGVELWEAIDGKCLTNPSEEDDEAEIINAFRETSHHYVQGWEVVVINDEDDEDDKGVVKIETAPNAESDSLRYTVLQGADGRLAFRPDEKWNAQSKSKKIK